MQETGRARRDGVQSVAHLLNHGILLNHVDGHMKSYVKTKGSRRKELLQHFDSSHLMHFEQKHLCCDNCASKCECGQPNCVRYATNPSYQKDIRAPIQKRKRHVLPNQRKAVEATLTRYHKALVVKLLGTTANRQIKTLTNVQFMLGFSEHQITQVVDNLETLFSLTDVYEVVEIWDKRHALEIISVISDVFDDVKFYNQSSCWLSEEKNYDFDDELLDEWSGILLDDELFDLFIDNISLTQLQDSLLQEEHNASNELSEAGIPDVCVEAMDINDLAWKQSFNMTLPVSRIYTVGAT